MAQCAVWEPRKAEEGIRTGGSCSDSAPVSEPRKGEEGILAVEGEATGDWLHIRKLTIKQLNIKHNGARFLTIGGGKGEN